jgi:hypothetical protein
MSLLNEQRKRNQTMQQVKELARAGQWQEAKKLVDTLPDTPDVIRVRERIEKQLYIATGEVPAVMEGTPVVVDTDEDLTSWVASDAPPKVKRKSDKPPLNIANAVIHLVSALLLAWGIFTFFSASAFPGEYSLYDASAVQITQVYSEATFLMLKAVTLFVLAAVLQIAILARKA